MADSNSRQAFREVQRLFNQVVAAADLIESGVNQEAFCQDLRELFDIIVNHQGKDDMFLEFCNEQRLLPFLIEVSFVANRHKRMFIVHKCFEIFQFFMYNLKDNQRGSVISVLANKTLYKMILYYYDLSDPDTLDYWINNIKTIIGKIKENETFLPLFFNSHPDYISFPLLTRTLVYFNYGSSMIRTTVSLFVLDFLNVAQKQEKLRRLVSYFPFANYFVYNVMYLHDCFHDVKAKVAASSLKAANLQSRLQFLGDLLNYMIDLTTHENAAVAQINLNLFAKLVLLTIVNDCLLGKDQDPSVLRLFAYFLRLVLNEFQGNLFVVNLIILVLFKQRIHRDLYAISSESVKSETSFLKDKRFKSLFEEKEPETMQLLEALHDGKIKPELIYQPLVENSLMTAANRRESQDKLLDLLEDHQKEYFAPVKDDYEDRGSKISPSQSLNGQNWENLAMSSPKNPFEDDASEFLGKQSPDQSIESSGFVRQANPFDLSTFPNDISHVANPFTNDKQQKGGNFDSVLDSSSMGYNTKQVNIFDSNFVLVDNMYDISLSKATATPGKKARSLLLETSRYYEQSVSSQLKACVSKVTRNLCASLPSKTPNRGLIHFMANLEKNSPELVLNALTANMKTYSVEQDDLLEIEETPNFRENPNYEAFCNLLASTRDDQKIINLDLVSLLMKLATANQALKEALLYIPVRRVEKKRGVVYSSLLDFVLIDTVRFFDGSCACPLSRKHYIYQAIDAMLAFKQTHGGFSGSDLVAVFREAYLKNIKAMNKDLEDPKSVQVYVRLLESDKDLEGNYEPGYRDRLDLVEYIAGNFDADPRKMKSPSPDSNEDFLLDPLVKIMYLKKLIYKYWPAETSAVASFQRSIRLKFENYKNNFLSNFWEVGEVYEIVDSIKYLCETKVKEKGTKAYVYLIEDDLNLILAERDASKPNAYKILIKERIYQVDFTNTEKTVFCSSHLKKTTLALKFERVILAGNIHHILKSNGETRKVEICKFLQGVLKTLLVDLPKEFDMQVMRESVMF